MATLAKQEVDRINRRTINKQQCQGFDAINLKIELKAKKWFRYGAIFCFRW